MRYIKFIVFFIFIVLLNFSKAQDSLDIALSYYPLKTGDYWEYRSDYWDYTDPPFYRDSSFYSIEVIGDTILSNDMKYKILAKKNILNSYNNYFYERIDSITANVYKYFEQDQLPNNEYLLDSLMAKTNDISKSTRDESFFDSRETICFSIDTAVVLKEATEVKTFHNRSSVQGFTYQLAKGFGYLGDFNCEFSCFSTDLVYARINGIEYGEKITSISHSVDTYQMDFKLYQNYPNPFNSESIIPFYLPKNAVIDISLYDIKGSFIKRILYGSFTSGNHSVTLKTNGLATGIYFYILNTNNYSLTKKLLYIK